MNNIHPDHIQEWLNSGVDPDIIRLNVETVEGLTTPSNRLFYSDALERTNTGRLAARYLKKYAHIEDGGWWCNGVDVLSPECTSDDLWGCFKPNNKRIINEYNDQGHFKKQKVIKYEHPPKTPTGIFALRISFILSWNIVRRLDNEEIYAGWLQRFWRSASHYCQETEIKRQKCCQSPERTEAEDTNQSADTGSIRELLEACQRGDRRTVDRIFQAISHRRRHDPSQFACFDSQRIEGLVTLEDKEFWYSVITTPNFPITLTEGVKKAGSLLTTGYAAIAVPGINNAYRVERDSFGNKIGLDKLIPQLTIFATPGREVSFAYDNDDNLKTRQNVNKAIIETGKLFSKKGCEVFVVTWQSHYKGVDDLIVALGEDHYHSLYQNKVSLSFFKLLDLVLLHPYVNLYVHERFLPDLSDFAPIQESKLIAIKSAKGTGKTELLTKIVKKATETGQRCLVITHRIQLTKDLCNRFAIDHIEEIRDSETGGILGYGLCIDSVHPYSMAQFNPSAWENALIILDECEQVIWHLLNSETCSKTRCIILENFSSLLQVVADSPLGKIYLSDADLTPISIEFIKRLIGFHVPTYVVANTIKPSKGKRKVTIYDGHDSRELIRALVMAIANGERPIIHTSAQKVTSKHGTVNLYKYLKKRFPFLKILVIDSETVQNPEHPAFNCMENLNEVLSQYDIVIASPTIETGVSIDIKGHFTSVWGIASGLQTVNAVCQALSRVREDVPRHLWATKYSPTQLGNGSTNIKELLRGQEQKSSLTMKLLGKFDGIAFQDDSKPESLQTWAKYAVLINHEMKNYRESIIKKLEKEGYEVTYQQIDKEESKVIATELNENKKQNFTEQCIREADASTPSEQELKDLEEKRTKTDSELLREKKGRLHKKYGGVDITPELVKRDYQGWYGKIRLHYYLTVGFPFVKKRDIKTLQELAEKNKGKVFKPDANKKTLLVIVGVLKALNIEQFLELNKQWTSDKLREWFEWVVSQRHYIKDLLGFSINPEKDTPMAVVQRLLALLDLKLTRIGRLGSRGARSYVYQLTTLDPDGREAVFERWLERDNVNTGAIAANTGV